MNRPDSDTTRIGRGTARTVRSSRGHNSDMGTRSCLSPRGRRRTRCTDSPYESRRAGSPKVPAGPYGSRARGMPGGKRSPREDLPLRFNVLEHQLVPEHRLVPEEEAERVLKAMKITRDQLPKIRKSDPVIQVLEKIEGPIEEGRIVRVTRVSGTAGVSEAYRLVIGR